MDAELVAAKKYGLFWTWSYVDDGVAGSIADGFYIYQPDRFWEPFWEVFDKLGQLNNYCFNQLVASEAKLSELQAEYGRAVEEKNAGAEVLDYLSEEVPAWENNVATFAKAAPVILLASFAEWGLKHIAITLFGGGPKKKERGMSDIKFYLLYLVHCGLEVENTDEILSRVGMFRSIRNDFAHGKWNELEVGLHALSLREAFKSVSAMFEAIEDAAWRRGEALV
nr:hypothetical protein BN993_06155 [Virgibacillus halodenitrificans]